MGPPHGTTTPGTQLGLNGRAFFDSNLIRLASSSAPSLRIAYNTSATSTIVGGTINAWSIATSTSAKFPAISINTASTTAAGPLVGIGTGRSRAMLELLIGATNRNGWIQVTQENTDQKQLRLGYSSTLDSGLIAAVTGSTGTVRALEIQSSNFTVKGTGNVGIGTTNPGAQLDLSTDSARKLTTTTWATGSDIRIKTNVESISDALDIISRVRPVKFHYTPEFLAAHPSVTDTDYYNFIAQEYQQVFPNSVSTSTDGLFYLNSSNMIPYAIAGIKELDQRTKGIGISGQANEGWTINQTTGRLTTSYGLDLGGNSLQNVSAIRQLADSALSKWSIDENGKLVVQELEVRGEGITVYDRATGQPKCVFVENDVVRSEEGVCVAPTD